MGLAPQPIVTVQCPHSVSVPALGPQDRVWGGEAPGIKGIEDIQARIGDGPRRAAEPFFTKALFAGRPALEDTPHLTISLARTLPLPARSAEARLPSRPEAGGCCRGSLPRRSRPPPGPRRGAPKPSAASGTSELRWPRARGFSPAKAD